MSDPINYPLKEIPKEQDPIKPMSPKDAQEAHKALVSNLTSISKELAALLNQTEGEQRTAIKQELEAYQGILNSLSKWTLAETLEEFDADPLPAFFKRVLSVAEQTEKALSKIYSFYGSSTYFELKSILSGVDEWFDEALKDRIEIVSLGTISDLIEPLLPYIKDETEAYKKDHGLETLSMSEFMQGHDVDPETGKGWSLFTKAAERGQSKEAAEVAASIIAPKSNAGKIQISSHLTTLDFPLDKVNSHAWNLLEQDTGKQLSFDVSGKRETQINIIYSIDFDNIGPGLRVTKKLEPFDKRVYTAIASLYAAGSQEITIGQIYYAMGYDGKPGATDTGKIDAAISKMNGAHIFLDNVQESQEMRGYDHFRYDGSLLPMERVTRIVNGQVVDGVLHLFREPPMQTFARQRKQITTIERKVLQSPLSKTNTNILIEDYLIERISHARTGRSPKKILFSTIFEKAQIKTAMQRTRAKDKIEKLMGFYVETHFISSYTVSKDGITIQFNS